MELSQFKIGDTVRVGDAAKGQRERTMLVYEETNPNGTKYLALEQYDERGRRVEFNGALSKFLEGFWGGIQEKR